MRLLFSAALLCLAGIVAEGQSPAPAKTAADLAKLGPQVGQRVSDFSLPDQNGTPRTLKSILGPNGAMLVFFRSADW
jgi:cytochrome oxidase Cu insertion factor (SCO1/SenC/PrrC family)